MSLLMNLNKGSMSENMNVRVSMSLHVSSLSIN